MIIYFWYTNLNLNCRRRLYSHCQGYYGIYTYYCTIFYQNIDLHYGKKLLSYCTKYYVVLNDSKNAQKHYESTIPTILNVFLATTKTTK